MRERNRVEAGPNHAFADELQRTQTQSQVDEGAEGLLGFRLGPDLDRQRVETLNGWRCFVKIHVVEVWIHGFFNNLADIYGIWSEQRHVSKSQRRTGQGYAPTFNTGYVDREKDIGHPGCADILQLLLALQGARISPLQGASASHLGKTRARGRLGLCCFSG